jgi:hypothetical protein
MLTVEIDETVWLAHQIKRPLDSFAYLLRCTLNSLDTFTAANVPKVVGSFYKSNCFEFVILGDPFSSLVIRAEENTMVF